MSVSNLAQDLRKESVKNPLDCALYLIKTENELEKRSDEIIYLANFYWKLGQRKKALEVAQLDTNYNSKVRLLVSFAQELKRENKATESEQLYLKAFSMLKENADFDSVWKNETLVEIIKTLVESNHAPEILEIADGINDNDDKAFILLAVADGYLEIERKDKALELIPRIIQLAQRSEWKDLELFACAKAATIYLKSGKENEANNLYREVLKNSASLQEVENIFVDDLWREVFKGYKSVGKYDKAIETLLDYQQINTLGAKSSYTDSNLVETYLANNQKENATDSLRQIIADDNGYDSLWVAKIFLKIGEEDLAKNIFFASQNDRYKQQIALELANNYENKNKIEFAVDILNLALKEVQKIKSDAPESEWMSTSPATEKARYLRDIANKFIELKQFDSALKVIQTIQKPYFKAQMLANLAEKHNSKNAVQLLNQALKLMRNNNDSMLDAQKYQVWNQIAFGFAKIGDKNKAGAVFAEILSKDKEIYSGGLDGYLLQTLAETGYYFEMSGLKSDERVSSALQNIIKNWQEENF